jgi:hypothetical protein
MYKAFLMSNVNTCVLSPQTDCLNSYILFITVLIKYAVFNVPLKVMLCYMECCTRVGSQRLRQIRVQQCSQEL